MQKYQHYCGSQKFQRQFHNNYCNGWLPKIWIVQSEAEPVQFKLENSHPSQKSSLQTGV